MSIIKRAKANFGVVPRAAMEEPGMSLKAKGLLAYLLCKPDDWQIYISQLAGVLKEGKGAVSSAIKELIDFGYIVREQKKDENNRFAGYDYSVFDAPINGQAVNEKPVNQKLVNGKLATTNKEGTKTEITKKEERGKEPASSEAYPPQFEKMWEYYGRDGNKASAFKMFKRLSASDMEEIRKAMPAYLAHVAKPGGPYKMHLSSYINPTYKKWRDELKERAPKKAETGRVKMTDWDALAAQMEQQ